MAAHDEHDLTEEGLVRARELVRIACVDVLPWRRAEGSAPEVCLIERLDRPGQWNLVGGRIRRDEKIGAALRRHLLSTLGHGVSWARSDFSHPEVVGQYFSERTAGYGFDPRQHAVSLTYTLELEGEVDVGGEATMHRWFDLEELPGRDQVGYDQADVLYTLIPAVQRQVAHPERVEAGNLALDGAARQTAWTWARKLSAVRRSTSASGPRASKPILSSAFDPSRISRLDARP